MRGKENQIMMKGSMYKSNISIDGIANKLIVEAGVRIHYTDIVVRGSGCIVRIGNGTTIGSANLVCMGIGNSISIGDECMFADGIEVWSTDSHPIYDSKGKVLNESEPVEIEDHVWLGKGCTILKGVKIGHDSVVGMKSVVTKDIPPRSVNAGVPSKVFRQNIRWSRTFIEC